MKKATALLLALVMAFALCACGPANEETPGTPSEQPSGAVTEQPSESGGENNPPAAGGTIMWLSAWNSGIGYDAAMAYAQDICEKLGYKFQVVYGDSFNDPAGNLSAVQNGMTKDVVGIIAMQDGGIQNIMDEYPDLYVCGFNTDMAAVYNEDGAAHGLLENDHWLGTIVDGYADGANMGHDYAQVVINGGYKKVATITFPGYAFPSFPKADAQFRAEIEEYNSTAADADKIEVVGEAKVLEFTSLDESWFMESGNGDLDAIVGFCAGSTFIYPTIKSAISNGICAADTKLISTGFDTADDVIADVGGDGVIQYIDISPVENIAWAITLIDNALQGKQYADFSPDRIDSARFVIDSKEDMDNVMSKSLNGTADPALAQITFEDLQTVLTRFNPDATYAQLNDLFHSDKILVDALA